MERKISDAMERRVELGHRRALAFIKATQGTGKPGSRSVYGTGKPPSER